MKAILRTMVGIVSLGMAWAVWAQSGHIELAGQGAAASAGRVPSRPGPHRSHAGPQHPSSGVLVVVDPDRVYSPEEAWARQAANDFYSRPIYMDEHDWRLPDAKTLHDRIPFGKPHRNSPGFVFGDESANVPGEILGGRGSTFP